MKIKDILLKVNEVSNKLDKSGHELNKVFVSDENGNIVTSSSVSREEVELITGLKANAQEQIDNINVSIEETNAELSSAKLDIADLTTAVNSNKENITTNGERLDIIEGEIILIKNEDLAIKEQIGDLEDLVGQVKIESDKIAGLEIRVSEAELSIGQNIEDITRHEDEIGLLKELIGSGEEGGVDLSNLYTKQGGEIYGDVVVKKDRAAFEMDAGRENKSALKWNATETEDNGLEVVVDGVIVGKFNSEGSLQLKRKDSEGYFEVSETSQIESVFVVDNSKENAYTDIAIQEAINKARENGGGEIIIPSGEYVLNNELLIYSNLTIRGMKGTVLKRRNSEMRVFMRADLLETDGEYNGLTDFTIKTVVFDGEEKTELTGMLCLGHGDNLLIEDCTFKNLWNNWHMIEINGCRNVIVQNNKFLNYKGTEAIQIDLMLDDTVYPFPCVKDKTVCENITIRDNIFKHMVGTAIGNHTFATGYIPKHLTIENNYFEDFEGKAVYVSDVKNYKVVKNKFINCFYSISIDVKMTASSEILIAENYIDAQKRADTESGLQGRGITISENSTNGIYDVSILNNIIKNVNRHGLGITANRVAITGNRVTLCGLNGIFVYGGEGYSLEENFVKGNNTKAIEGFYDVVIGGNPNLETRYCNLNNNMIWNLYIATKAFPVVAMQNNFMEIPILASGIIQPNAHYNYINGTFKVDGLVK